jgi:hypothetical protein
LSRFIHGKWQQTQHELIRRYFYLVKTFCKVQVEHLSKEWTVNADHILYVLSEALFQQDSNAIRVTAWQILAQIRFSVELLEAA